MRPLFPEAEGVPLVPICFLVVAWAITTAPVTAAVSGPNVPGVLARAEALNAGSDGRFDPAAAQPLFEEAAATGDSRAVFRLALIVGNPSSAGFDLSRAQALHARSVAEVERLARAGDSYAQSLVGTAALLGIGGAADDAKARQWLERAARGDQLWAWHNLAWMMETGRGHGDPDPRAAREAYLLSAELGNASSMYDVGRLSLVKGASPAECESGRGWLERSAATGHPMAVAYLGKLLYYGRKPCIDPDAAAALPWLEKAVAAGRDGAAYDLGIALVLGDGGRKDVAAGVSLIERSIREFRDVLGAETLSFLYATGIAVPRDTARARSYLAEAARWGGDGFGRLGENVAVHDPLAALFRNGLGRLEALSQQRDSAACAFLATFFFVGRGVPEDDARAVELARCGAEGDEPGAMRILGWSYRHGLGGVERDYGEAVRWWRRGAEAGDSFSMMFLSQSLMAGEIVDRDLQEGLRWLIRSAEAGNWWATGDLGHLYDEGWHGLARDEAEAARWKAVRARGGDDEARGWLRFHGYPLEPVP